MVVDVDGKQEEEKEEGRQQRETKRDNDSFSDSEVNEPESRSKQPNPEVANTRNWHRPGSVRSVDENRSECAGGIEGLGFNLASR